MPVPDGYASSRISKRPPSAATQPARVISGNRHYLPRFGVSITPLHTKAPPQGGKGVDTDDVEGQEVRHEQGGLHPRFRSPGILQHQRQGNQGTKGPWDNFS